MPRAILAALLLTPALAAQTTWLVDASGGGQFVTIQEAVQAARDGDLILVRQANLTNFWNFTLTKGVAIVGISWDGRRAEIGGQLTIAGIGPHQQVVLRSLEYDPVYQAPVGVRVQDCAGRVVLEDVVLDGRDPNFVRPWLPGVVVTDSAHVALHRCSVTGAVGIQVARAAVTISDSTIRGISADGINPIWPGPGIAVNAGRVWLSASTVVGGSNPFGGHWASAGEPGMVLADSAAAVAAGTLLGGYGLGGFAASVYADVGSLLTVDSGTGMPQGVSGAGNVLLAEMGWVGGGLGAAGVAAQFTLSGPVFALGLLAVSWPEAELSTPLGALWLRTDALSVLAVGSLPVSGAVAVPVGVLPGTTIALQGAVLDGGVVRLSPPVLTCVR